MSAETFGHFFVWDKPTQFEEFPSLGSLQEPMYC
jgi:hypothetical protein